MMIFPNSSADGAESPAAAATAATAIKSIRPSTLSFLLFCSSGHALSMRFWSFFFPYMIVLGHTARWHSKMFCPLSSKGELQSTVAAKESICCQSAWIKPFIIWPLCWSEPRMKRRPRWRLAAPSKEAVGPSVWCNMLKKKSQNAAGASFFFLIYDFLLLRHF